jgi:hypothetical protein
VKWCLGVCPYVLCQVWQRCAIDMCTVVRPHCSFLSGVLLKVSFTAVIDTVAGLYLLDNQNSIPGGDKFLRSSQTSSSKDVPVGIFTRLQPEQSRYLGSIPD